ncbi:MAG: family 10 glycosylhydrolase [Oscillospiraceae bacterium]|nr:family 10 glycosylhydrolase [Oscillospiraceae bacterium]
MLAITLAITLSGCGTADTVREKALPVVAPITAPFPNSDMLSEFYDASDSSDTVYETGVSEITDITTNPTAIANTDKSINYDTQKAMWFSYIDISKMLTKKTEEQFTDSFRTALANCEDMGINTLYVHVRPFGDALYKSDYFPYSKIITGVYGQTPPYDPLEIMVREAHAKQLSLHAWVNPFRLNTVAEMESYSGIVGYPVNDWYNSGLQDDVATAPMLEYDGRWYLNPSDTRARKLIADGAYELVERYNVDGVNIDDYFYPTGDLGWDNAYYVSHSNGVNTSAEQFRYNACTEVMSAINNAVHAANSTALFGICPAGNIDNNYLYEYADVRVWASALDDYGRGVYCDYVAPQLYFGYENETQPFETVLLKWRVFTRVPLYVGLACYKEDKTDKYAGTGATEWLVSGNAEQSVIARQIETALADTDGYALYSYYYAVKEG